MPIVAVFTKYDQFKINVELRLEDKGCENLTSEHIDKEIKKCFQAEYLEEMNGQPRHVKLESKIVFSSLC